MSQDDTAPKNLGALFGMVKTAIKGMKKGEICRRRAPVVRGPSACIICEVKFTTPTGTAPVIALCPGCKKLLSDGWTAAKHDTTYLFFKSKSMADLAGKAVRVSAEEMARLKQYFDEQKPRVPQPPS